MKKFDSINVIPFIDVMLVLLAIVLTTSTFIAKGIIPVDLPQSSSQKMLKKKSISITIKQDGSIYLSKNRLNKEELQNQLKKIDKHSNILIRCDKNSKFQSFVDVMQIVKDIGFENLSIVTKE